MLKLNATDLQLLHHTLYWYVKDNSSWLSQEDYLEHCKLYSKVKYLLREGYGITYDHHSLSLTKATD